MKTAAKLEHIAAQIRALSPARRLLLASRMIEQAKADVDIECAIDIAEAVVMEWRAAKLFGRKP